MNSPVDLGFLRSSVALSALLLGFACASGDLSAYLESGRCDDDGSCAPGFECRKEDQQCVPEGTNGAGAGVAGGDAGTAGSEGGAAGSQGGSEAGAGVAGGDAGTAGSEGGAAGSQGGSGGGAAGAQAGSGPEQAGQAGAWCEEGQTLCEADCVELASSDENCGACGNPCALGEVSLVCGAGHCSCDGQDERCGGTTVSGTCDEQGRCSCAGQLCAVGEICEGISGGGTRCACDGSSTCTSSATCCLGEGCVDLAVDSSNCGGCGQSCPLRFTCNQGNCHCPNRGQCSVGAPGECLPSGRCQCGDKVCDFGQRCVGDGVCG